MLLLGATLIGCWLVQRRRRYLLWVASSYTLVGSALAWQSLMVLADLHRWAIVTGVMYLFGAWCFARGMAGYYAVSARPRIGLLIGAVVLLALYYYSRIEVDLWMRMHWLNAGLGLLQLLPAGRILQRRLPTAGLERAMYWLYVLFAINTSVRPLLSLVIGSRGENAASFSSYWLMMLATTLLFALLFTMLLLANTVRDAMTALRAERNMDPLTNLLNRRAFQEAAEPLLRDPRQGPWTLLIGDIDHFKRINDTWGHAHGDHVLQTVAGALTQQVRNEDLVARFGGEEFVLLLRTDLASAESIAQRIRTQLSEDKKLLPNGGRMTISFGIVPIADLAELSASLSHADRLLYQAKQAGRDRVHVARPAGETPAL
ncbi:diguanylate cyclase [Pantoea sp. 18069]|uniref:GGDEF domain-containing protein n=1 Tax=Pantoea sp. 18069 TaxID=2681415 RepID=UPI0013584E9D|nr:GGDEF domain-containing protein [Pantoea sp. 18069]